MQILGAVEKNDELVGISVFLQSLIDNIGYWHLNKIIPTFTLCACAVNIVQTCACK